MFWVLPLLPIVTSYTHSDIYHEQFPVKFCGSYSMVACTNPSYIGAELFVDYNTIRFTPVKKYGFIHIKKNLYGSIFLKGHNKTKIVWLPSVKYDIETQIIPRITIPVKHKCSKLVVTYNIDSSYNWVTILDKTEQYIFRRNIVITPKSDSIVKIFLTQLLFDLIIRNISH